MPQLEFDWWAAHAATLATIVVGSAVLIGGAVALRRYLERLESDRLEEELRRRRQAGRRSVSALPVQARPILWVRALPVIVGLIAAIVLLDELEVTHVDSVTDALRAALSYPLPSYGTLDLTPGHVIGVLLMLSFASWVSTWAQRATRRRMETLGTAQDGVTSSVQRLVHYGVMAIGFLLAFNTLGLDLTTLFAAGAVFAVGIGFGLQSIAQNFVSGIILLVERTIKTGDVLTVDGRMVRVERLGIRATIGRTLDDDELIMPNGKLLDTFVVNYHLSSDVVRARARVGVAYSSDVDRVLEVLHACATALPERDEERDPVVFLRDFGDSAIEFEVSVWVKDAFRREQILSKLRIAMWRALRDAEITIAFPQVDVHLDPPVLAALSRAEDAAPLESAPPLR